MKVKDLILTALFAALTAIGAFLGFKFVLASITLQFLFTAMAGVHLGRRYGAFDARRPRGSLCHRRSLYGADRERLSWQGPHLLAGHAQRNADLSARRYAQDRGGKRAVRRGRTQAPEGGLSLFL